MVFERVPFEALQGLLGEQRTLAEFLTIVSRKSRRQSRALERHGREVIKASDLLSILLQIQIKSKYSLLWLFVITISTRKRY